MGPPHGSVDVARLLLANGADLSIRNRKNDTPLEAARIHEHPEIVALINSVTVERPAWKKTQQADTLVAYQRFISMYPDGVFAPKARAELGRLEKKQEVVDAQRAEQKAKLEAFEASLPPEVRRDKYMVQLANHLKHQQYQQALEIFPKLEALPIATDPSLKFFYGEALLETGQPVEAMQKLYKYIEEQGSGATHYARALELINQAELQL